MKIRTKVKSGGVSLNHSQKLVVRTGVKSGKKGGAMNHSQKLVIRTGVKSGGVKFNHSQSRA